MPLATHCARRESAGRSRQRHQSRSRSERRRRSQPIWPLCTALRFPRQATVENFNFDMVRSLGATTTTATAIAEVAAAVAASAAAAATAGSAVMWNETAARREGVKCRQRLLYVCVCVCVRCLLPWERERGRKSERARTFPSSFLGCADCQPGLCSETCSTGTKVTYAREHTHTHAQTHTRTHIESAERQLEAKQKQRHIAGPSCRCAWARQPKRATARASWVKQLMRKESDCYDGDVDVDSDSAL